MLRKRVSALRHWPDRAFRRWRRAAVTDRLLLRDPPGSVVFICHGNICRSPFAAAAMKRALGRRAAGVRIESAGLLIGPGRPSPETARSAAAARDIDLSRHRSRTLTADAVHGAGLLVVMDVAQRRALRHRFGVLPDSVVVLGDLDPRPFRTRAITDPVNGSRDVFDTCYARIDRCVDALAAALFGGGTDALPPTAGAEGGGRNATARNGRSIAANGLDARGAAATSADDVKHHFTVDVEEYFQVSAFEGIVPRSRWAELESRVAPSVDWLLELLARHGAGATFFVLGWIAERHPNVVRAIADAGHEIASHGWDHRRVTELSPDEFRRSVRQSKALLEDVSGRSVVGYRAPSFSIVPGREWALDILIEEGYRYDSSLFPIRRPGYGHPGADPAPHSIARPAGRIAERPPATLRRFGVTLPAGGGAYFRLFPYQLAQTALLDSARRGEPATFYLHPWEIDPDQPRLEVPWATRLRHYGGLGRTRDRLRRLLSEFRFAPIAAGLGGAAAVAAAGMPRRAAV